MNGDGEPFSVFSGSEVAVQDVAEVPQSFNDTWFVSEQAPGESNISPEDPGFFNSQSVIENQPFVESGSTTDVNLKQFSNGFLDVASKLLSQLRGNTGQDRNAATGRARPQRSVADLLGLTGAAGTVNVQAPGNQGMWMIVIIAGAFLALLMFAKR